MKPNGKLKKYIALHEKYLGEYDILFKHKNYSQASEKLWGTTASIVKAIAASRNKTVKSHDGIGFYIASIAKELKDNSILNIINVATAMHQNFYEDNLPPDAIRNASQKIKQFTCRMRAKFQI